MPDEVKAEAIDLLTIICLTSVYPAGLFYWPMALLLILYKSGIWLIDGIWPVVTIGTALYWIGVTSDFIYSTDLKGIQIILSSIFDVSLLTSLLIWFPLITFLLLFSVIYVCKALYRELLLWRK